VGTRLCCRGKEMYIGYRVELKAALRRIRLARGMDSQSCVQVNSLVVVGMSQRSHKNVANVEYMPVL